MEYRKGIGRDVLALVLLSLGGMLLHLKIHPLPGNPDHPQNPANVIPFVFGLLGTVAVPVLLGWARTFVIGYLINGMGVVIGTIVMAHMTLAALPEPSAAGIFIYSSLPYILILLPKLFIGQNILYHYHPNGMGRMFTGFWWLKHFCYLTIVYAIGHFLWR